MASRARLGNYRAPRAPTGPNVANNGGNDRPADAVAAFDKNR
jgi:hypothetical protein